MVGHAALPRRLAPSLPPVVGVQEAVHSLRSQSYLVSPYLLAGSQKRLRQLYLVWFHSSDSLSSFRFLLSLVWGPRRGLYRFDVGRRYAC